MKKILKIIICICLAGKYASIDEKLFLLENL